VEKVKKLFLYNSTHSYDAHFHSTKNKRGVGILISKRINYTVEKTYKDEDENILGLTINIDGFNLRIFSIYGPNFDNKAFYNRIDYFLSQDSQVAAVLGGDWNSSYSTSPTADNIDIRNMRNPPSLVRSGWLREICNNHNLSDPFRALHPNLKDYTFSPPGARINRSRLDFFLIYDELIPLVRTCSIKETQQIKLLDHKPVILDFKKDKYASKPFINKTILSLPRTDDVVLASVLDTYLIHVDADDADNIRIATPPGVHHAEGFNPIRAEQTKVGNLLSLIRDYNLVYEQSLNDPQNRLISLELAAKNTEITILKNSLLSFEIIEQLKIIPSADIFLETLLSNVKGNVISFQQWIKKTENSRKAKIVNKIREIRTNPDPDFERIGTLENELLDITDKEIREKVKSMKIFECLNAEKPTPLFMSLARCRSSSKKLSALKKPDGTEYEGDRERNEGIVQYYENLYKKPAGERSDYTNCIEDFLGPTVLNHVIVQNSKLTENEKTLLDMPLSIEELDISINKANMNSAPGIDGLSNKFLKKYWVFFRTALFRYCNCCFEKNELTANFLNASIKLIPKKGDVTDLKNWRPISLLSNMYKIISRAINNRLNKVVNRICSRAQKGFNDSRFTQECLINVIETINHCNQNGISGAVVAVDMAKAFDTLSHGYLEQVFSFFNMGPYIRKWLSLLGTKRTACIILDDNTYSRSFKLGRGSAQGDNISPDTFNFGDQILIFKIELDPNIAGIWRNFQIPPLVPPRQEEDAANHLNPNNNDLFLHESGRETVKNESLADDNTTLTLMAAENLRYLRQILDDFSAVSGLTCNYDKTNVLAIGPPVDNIDLAGFSQTDSIKLLGLNISKNLDTFDETFVTIHDKIRDLIAFWDRFRLSLPGRISVIKNLLIPQLNYIGSFLDPSPYILESIQSTLDSFALHGLQVARDRRYLSPQDGGLGLFNLKNFLQAQKCSWIKRADAKCIDNWRFDLKRCAPDGNLMLLRNIDVNQAEHPILYNLASAFSNFSTALSKKDSNYKKTQIFLNPHFVRSGTDNGMLDIAFFTRDVYDDCKSVIRNLSFDDCFSNGTFKTKQQFRDIGLRLNDIVWIRLRGAMSHAKATFGSVPRKSDSSSVTNFVRGFKKGSKKFREIIEYDSTLTEGRKNLRTVITFSEITDTTIPDSECLGKILALWNRSFLPNELREFFFKERNNCLPLNNRIVNFVQNASDKCSFCKIINPDTQTRESFAHLFLECPVTRSNLNGFIRITRLPVLPNDPNLKNVFWYGIANGKLDKEMLLIFGIFRYCIWKAKTAKTIPRSLNISESFFNMLQTIFSISFKTRDNFLKNPNCANLLQAMG